VGYYVAGVGQVNGWSDLKAAVSANAANIASLQTTVSSHVGNTGNPHQVTYSQLPDKPTIPAAPVQSNWNETNTGSLAYIQNKPTIPAPPVIPTGVAQNVALGTTTGTANSITGASLPVSGTLPIGNVGNTALAATTNTDSDTTTPAVASNTIPTLLQAIWNKIRSVANALGNKLDKPNGTVSQYVNGTGAVQNIAPVVGNPNADNLGRKMFDNSDIALGSNDFLLGGTNSFGKLSYVTLGNAVKWIFSQFDNQQIPVKQSNGSVYGLKQPNSVFGWNASGDADCFSSTGVTTFYNVNPASSAALGNDNTRRHGLFVWDGNNDNNPAGANLPACVGIFIKIYSGQMMGFITTWDNRVFYVRQTGSATWDVTPMMLNEYLATLNGHQIASPTGTPSMIVWDASSGNDIQISSRDYPVGYILDVLTRPIFYSGPVTSCRILIFRDNGGAPIIKNLPTISYPIIFRLVKISTYFDIVCNWEVNQV
jgi:hypothetical protein